MAVHDLLVQMGRGVLPGHASVEAAYHFRAGLKLLDAQMGQHVGHGFLADLLFADGFHVSFLSAT
jgi:hypothetical protein